MTPFSHLQPPMELFPLPARDVPVLKLFYDALTDDERDDLLALIAWRATRRVSESCSPASTPRRDRRLGDRGLQLIRGGADPRLRPEPGV